MQVTLHGKPDCPLCEELKADLQALQAELGFELLERNIEEDERDWQRYRYLIPVLEIDGGPVLFPPHSGSQVRQALIDSGFPNDGRG